MYLDSTGKALPTASSSLPKRYGNSLPHCSNKLAYMAKERNKHEAEDVLAENFRRLRDKKKDAGLWKGPGVSLKTANNIENSRHQTTLQTIKKIAESVGVEPFQLLLPVKDAKFLDVVLAWGQTDDSGRDNLHAIAEAMLRRRNENASRADTPTTHRKRDRAG